MLAQFQGKDIAALKDLGSQVKDYSLGGLSKGAFLALTNAYRSRGVDFDPTEPMNRGLQPNDLTQVWARAYTDHEKNPIGWQNDIDPVTKRPFGDFLDAGGNPLAKLAFEPSDMTKQRMSNMKDQGDLLQDRKKALDLSNAWFEKYKGVFTQTQIDNMKSVIKYRTDVQTPEGLATIQMIKEGRMPEILQQIESLRLGNIIKGQQIDGTYNPKGSTAGGLDLKTQAAIDAKMAKRNTILAGLKSYTSPSWNGGTGALIVPRLLVDENGNYMVNPDYPDQAIAQSAINEVASQKKMADDLNQQAFVLKYNAMHAPKVSSQSLSSGAVPGFDATKYVGTAVNKDNQPGCVDGVCLLAKKAGLPVPNTRNAADLEKQLPKYGWNKVSVAQMQPNDIVISTGTGPSGRHAQWFIGGNRAVAADTKSGGYSNKLGTGYVDLDGSSTVWRHSGPSGVASSSQASSGKSVSSSAKAQARALLGIGDNTDKGPSTPNKLQFVTIKGQTFTRQQILDEYNRRGLGKAAH